MDDKAKLVKDSLLLVFGMIAVFALGGFLVVFLLSELGNLVVYIAGSIIGAVIAVIITLWWLFDVLDAEV